VTEQLPILLPCPFCGVVPVIERCADTFDYLTGPRKWWGICCRSTLNLGGSCAVEIRPQASIEAAAKRWNTRAPAQSALDEANAIIEQRNAMCSAYFAEVAELRREVEALRADADELIDTARASTDEGAGK